jgi:hypothetical protein
MRRIALLMTGTLFGVTVSSQSTQSLLDCVDPDVLRGLMFQSSADQSSIVTTAVPKELAGVTLPAQFSWIGSIERDMGRVITNGATSTTAAYKTSLTPEAARASAVATLASRGWELQAAMPSIGSGVFNASSLPPQQTMCRDKVPVTINANAIDGVTYLNLVINRGGNSCDARPRPASVAADLDPYMPKLDMPVDPKTGMEARMRGSGGGGGTGSRDVRAEFSTSDSVGNVGNHFARQMASQGWTRDATWTGESFAGSSWVRTGDNGATIVGSLHVTSLDGGSFRAVLNVAKAN